MDFKMSHSETVVGIDVGGIKKGFHAVVNLNGHYHHKFHSTDPKELADWVLSHQPIAVAIDAPAMFSEDGRSRFAERELVNNGLRCFYTPTRALALKSRFYDWVFNGERLYQAFGLPLFSGEPHSIPCVMETFPHAIDSLLWANQPSGTNKESKLTKRTRTLIEKVQYDVSQLNNIDFIDAALCAVAADYFAKDQFIAYGCQNEGFIVLPKGVPKPPA